MDVCELHQASEKHSAVETPRPPLVPAERNNGATRRSKTREVSSRYRSPTPSAATGSKRYPSPNTTRTDTASSALVPKRAISAERRRPSTPPSPPSPSTPVHDTTAVIQLASRKLVNSRMPESLWPCTMRSLSVSFQSDTVSLPISKREKPVTHALSDRNLRPPSNVVYKQSEMPPGSRKPTPERKRSPLKGKNAPAEPENSKPVDGVHGRPADQYGWPSRVGGRVASNALGKSVDLANRTTKGSSALYPGMTLPSSRRLSIPGSLSTPLQNSASDSVRQISSAGSGKVEACPIEDNSLRIPKVIYSRLFEKPKIVTPPSLLLPSVSRSPSPSRTRTSGPSRGVGPSRTRPSSPARQANSSTSVLSYIVDIRKGKKVANHIEDVHQLRLLYNRHLQWRYANARSNVALNSQKVTAEKSLVNVWRTTSELWDSVTEKRIDLLQLRLKLKLYSVLNEQVAFLNRWPLIEKDHAYALAGSIEDLEASTLRLPVTRGARADIDTVKAAVCSAISVMQTMGSSVCSVLSKVEGMNCVVSELAEVAAQERAMLDECEALMASTAAMQVEEYSLRTHLIQLKQLIYGK